MRSFWKIAYALAVILPSLTLARDFECTSVQEKGRIVHVSLDEDKLVMEVKGLRGRGKVEEMKTPVRQRKASVAYYVDYPKTTTTLLHDQVYYDVVYFDPNDLDLKPTYDRLIFDATTPEISYWENKTNKYLCK